MGKQTLLYILTVMLFFSYLGCTIKVIGLYNGYKDLTTEEKTNVILLNAKQSICELNQDYKIYGVSGNQLLECLSQNDTSLVYDWAPRCDSEYCVLLSACQDFCSKKGYNLYVVAEYYDMKIMNAQNTIDFPILTANHNYYNEYSINKLKNKFEGELLNGQPLPKESETYRYLFFDGDKLIDAKKGLF